MSSIWTEIYAYDWYKKEGEREFDVICILIFLENGTNLNFIYFNWFGEYI